MLPLRAFAEVNKLPLDMPHVKVAILMRAYRKNPQDTWCPSPNTLWSSRDAQSLAKLEWVLHYFMSTCKAAVAAMPDMKQAALIANVNFAAAEAFANCKNEVHEPRDDQTFC